MTKYSRYAHVNLVVVLLMSISVIAQVKTPSLYSSNINLNYVRTWDAKAPQTDANRILVSGSVDSFIMTTHYFDGLGRPLQTVTKQITPLGKDLVTPVVYDEFGREQYKYQSFAANNTGGNSSISDGLFKLNPFQQDSVFYSSGNLESPIKGQNETWFYAKTIFETSPLNRVLNTYAPGNSWVGNNVGVGQQYLINTVYDSVRIWSVTDAVSDVPTTTSTYSAGELLKNVTTDEHSKQIVEYKDKEGKVILKKVQLSGSPGTAHVGWLCTYYVYDDWGNLRFVLQPQAIQVLLANGNWTISNTVRDELCFYYGYDIRNRMTTKKVPGAGEVYMIYDTRDRLVYTQDVNMRANNWWLTTIYDALNRQVMTVMMTYTGTRTQLQSFADDVNNLSGGTTVTVQGSNVSSNTSFTLREIGRTSYRASQSIEFKPGFESELNAEFTAEIDTASPTPSSYTVTGNPFPSGVTYKALTITNYDDYSQTSRTYSTANNSKLTTNAPFAESLASSSSLQTRGMITSTRIWALENTTLTTGKWLETVNFYDEKGRLVQVQNDNLADGKDTLTTKYDFSGKVLCTYMAHKNPSGNTTNLQIKTNTTYDVAGRTTSIQKQLNDNSTTNKTVAQFSYDEIGELKKKVFGGFLDSLEYDYNIRGWMLGANRDYAKSTSSTSHYFGFDLAYDRTNIQPTGGSSIGVYASGQYNGNITGMVWKSTGDDEIRKYDFTYDAVNRLIGADFNQYTSGTFNKTAGIDFSVSSLSYDANGNIQSMNQKGWKLGGSSFIDQLSYTYNPSSNKLLQVSDASNDNASKLGDFKYDPGTKTSTDYTYDGNGNLVLDNNKKISSITYNYLNLPSVITVTGKGTITYTYDASGNKLKKEVNETGHPLKTTLYIGGFVYENDTLQFITHEEGRIRLNPQTSSFAFDYFLKDHLGNVRMVLTEEQKTDQYPAATMETTNATVEESLYSNLPATRTDAPSGYGGGTPQKVALVKAATGYQKIGPAILLKVMAGDKFNLTVNSWWNSGSSPQTPLSALNDLVAALAGSVGNLPGSNHPTSQDLTNSGVLTPNATSFLNSQSYNTAKPKAYINWILLDERFSYVSSSSGFEQVGSSGVFTTHTRTNLAIDKSGYLYIYVSNETPNIDVFFDNLQVTHVRGPLIEEAHYYPFGLTMAGISSKAINFGNPENNRNKFQGQEFAHHEFSDGTGLEMYEFKYRMDDPQAGRFWQIDPLADKYRYNSVYSFSENHVTTHVELEGLEKKAINGPNLITWPSHDGGLSMVAKNVLEKGNYKTDNKPTVVSEKFKIRVKGSASIDASAGAYIKAEGVGGGGGAAFRVVFSGFKDNEPYFAGKNLKTGEQTMFKSGDVDILGVGGDGETKYVKNSEGTYEKVEVTNTVHFLGVFSITENKDLKSGVTKETYNIGGGATVGYGLLANGEAKVSFYERVTKE